MCLGVCSQPRRQQMAGLQIMGWSKNRERERMRECEFVFWILLTQVKFTSCDSRFVWALFPGQPVTSGRDTNDEHILSPDPRFRLYTSIFVWPLDLCMYIYKYYAAIHCFVH